MAQLLSFPAMQVIATCCSTRLSMCGCMMGASACMVPVKLNKVHMVKFHLKICVQKPFQTEREESYLHWPLNCIGVISC